MLALRWQCASDTSASTAQLTGSYFAVTRGALRTVKQGRVSAKPDGTREEAGDIIRCKGMRNVG